MSKPPPNAAASPTSDRWSVYDRADGCPNGVLVTRIKVSGREVGFSTYSTLFPASLNVELDRTAPTSACANTAVRLPSRAVITGPAVKYRPPASSWKGKRTAQVDGGWQKDAVPRNGSTYRDTLAFTPRCPCNPRSIEASNPKGPLPRLRTGATAWPTVRGKGGLV